MSEETLEELAAQAAFRDRTDAIRTALNNDRLPEWERRGLHQMLQQEYHQAGYREDLIFNGSFWEQRKE